MHRHKLSYVHSPSMICLYTLYHYMFIRCQNVAARRSVAIVLSTNIANCCRRPSTTAMPACPPSRISADNCPIYSRSEIAAPVGGDVGAIPTSSLYKLCCCAATQKIAGINAPPPPWMRGRAPPVLHYSLLQLYCDAAE